MKLIQLKLEKETKIVKYITLIRKFDPALSVGQIKSDIENNTYAVSFDLNYFDVVEELQGMDRKKAFRGLIAQLIAEGAQLSLYADGELCTLEYLDNRLETIEKIKEETERDMDLESEEE